MSINFWFQLHTVNASRMAGSHVYDFFHSFFFPLCLLQIMKLEIEEISALRSFVFLWCGSGEGLDLGRMVK